METADRKRWLRMVLLAGALYGVVGVGLGELSKLAPSSQIQAWRLAAWIVSAVVLASHIWYGRLRLESSHKATALHASLAAAFGAFLLAVAANVHGQWVGSGHQRALAIALVAWPALVAVPAFLAAIIASAALGLVRRKA